MQFTRRAGEANFAEVLILLRRKIEDSALVSSFCRREVQCPADTCVDCQSWCRLLVILQEELRNLGSRPYCAALQVDGEGVYLSQEKARNGIARGCHATLIGK